ncbi:MAG: TRAP transporter small permease subunit [Alphaproteobacteria bacterium]|nr:TRAP transporter small permease subunit [Alphaproteobacteria bacterium]
MEVLERFAETADRIGDVIGRALSWLVLGVVLVCFSVVVLRYGFHVGDIRLQQAYVWMHACVFMAGAGYTLIQGGHVRVDVFYARMSRRRRAWVDLLGTVFFLLPWLGVIAWTGWSFVAMSWRIAEPSSEVGGLPAVYLLKSVILVFCGLMTVQGLALAARSLIVLMGGAERGERADV